MGRLLTITYIFARRCVIALIGGTVVLLGVLMIVLPGPAFVVIPAGLAILGLEFACARRWLGQLRSAGSAMLGKTLVLLGRKDKVAGLDARNAEGSNESQVRRETVTASVRANTKTSYYRPL